MYCTVGTLALWWTAILRWNNGVVNDSKVVFGECICDTRFVLSIRFDETLEDNFQLGFASISKFAS